MGKGRIINNIGEGLYEVELIFETGRIEAEIERMTQQADALQGRINEIDLEISGIEADEDLSQEEKANRIAVLQQEKDLLELRITSYQKKIAEYQTYLPSGEEPETYEVWCADASVDLAGEVGTIEIGRQRKHGINIRPGFVFDDRPYDLQRDGILQKPMEVGPYNSFYNLAIHPGAQKWIPYFRYARIVSVDKENDQCDLILDPLSMQFLTPFNQQLEVNPPDQLPDDDELYYENVPIEYMDCNSLVFEEEDHVLVQFTDGDYTAPKVIGFKSEPKSCEENYCVVRFIWDTGSTLDNTYALHESEDLYFKINMLSGELDWVNKEDIEDTFDLTNVAWLNRRVSTNVWRQDGDPREPDSNCTTDYVRRNLSIAGLQSPYQFLSSYGNKPNGFHGVLPNGCPFMVHFMDTIVLIITKSDNAQVDRRKKLWRRGYYKCSYQQAGWKKYYINRTYWEDVYAIGSQAYIRAPLEWQLAGGSDWEYWWPFPPEYLGYPLFNWREQIPCEPAPWFVYDPDAPEQDGCIADPCAYGGFMKTVPLRSVTLKWSGAEPFCIANPTYAAQMQCLKDKPKTSASADAEFDHWVSLQTAWPYGNPWPPCHPVNTLLSAYTGYGDKQAPYEVTGCGRLAGDYESLELQESRGCYSCSEHYGDVGSPWTVSLSSQNTDIDTSPCPACDPGETLYYIPGGTNEWRKNDPDCPENNFEWKARNEWWTPLPHPKSPGILKAAAYPDRDNPSVNYFRCQFMDAGALRLFSCTITADGSITGASKVNGGFTFRGDDTKYIDFDNRVFTGMSLWPLDDPDDPLSNFYQYSLVPFLQAKQAELGIPASYGWRYNKIFKKEV